MMNSSSTTDNFNNFVKLRYDLYESLLLTLPFDGIENIGLSLSLFSKHCQKSFKDKSIVFVLDIVDAFFKEKLSYTGTNNEYIHSLTTYFFKFLQFIERQIVLFDAIEDSAFNHLHNRESEGTLYDFSTNLKNKSAQKIKEAIDNYQVRVVLTAHPTQFYTPQILGILDDLRLAIEDNNLPEIQQLLLQLGKTKFTHQEKPTPIDEAEVLIQYLENIFYKVFPSIEQDFYKLNKLENPSFTKDSTLVLGFWPGGDRDGNPYVTTDVTLAVAKKLKTAIIKCYFRDVYRLKKRLTFDEIYDILTDIEKSLYAILEQDKSIKCNAIIKKTLKIRNILVTKHSGFLIEKVDHFLYSLRAFGFFFASLDIRQNSDIHSNIVKKIFLKKKINYNQLEFKKKINCLSQLQVKQDQHPLILKNPVEKDTLKIITTIPTIQKENGKRGCHRYIISNTSTALNVLEVLFLFHYTSKKNEYPAIDIVPLFESIEDLKNSDQIMETLYTTPLYKQHLKKRKNQQTIMLGYSDGTKDGGYLAANWSIYQAKIRLSEITKKYNINVVFFDGRGGPPGRGGGDTNKFYRSLDKRIEDREIQVTIQGQTISSKLGNYNSAKYFLENLFTAGLENKLYKNEEDIDTAGFEILNELQEISFKKYDEFKKHPQFIDYLERVTPLNYYSQAKIGSRPTKRKKSNKLNLSDLRAIPFVGSWSQMKHNIPGYFGLGSALASIWNNKAKVEKIKNLYQNSLFFRTLILNSMQSLAKTFLSLTSYLKNDYIFSDFWGLIETETHLTTKMLLKISNHKKLLAEKPNVQKSIVIREQIVLPLLVIQQYSMILLRKHRDKEIALQPKTINALEKIIIKSLAGNINASRNSA